MSPIQRVKKASTRKGKQYLLSKEPKVVEDPKRTVIVGGRKTSDRIRRLMKDWYELKKPEALRLSKKHDITIFENCTPVEQICRKSEASLFLVGSHSKKRPNNIVVGRLFNYVLLDMVELSVDSFEDMRSFNCPKINVGTKPFVIFHGAKWEDENDKQFVHLKSLFVDMFHRERVDGIRLHGTDHVMCFTATDDGKIFIRSYKVYFKKSGTSTPRIELEEMGPNIDFSIRRSKLPSDDLFKEACKTPRVLKVVKKRNISRDGLGTAHANIHVGKQPIQRLQTRKMKGLKKTAQERSLHRKQVLDDNSRDDSRKIRVIL